jgi:hypothetical protein
VRRRRELPALVVAAVLASGAGPAAAAEPEAAEPAAAEDRPTVRGGVWDKPSLARAGDRLVLGGYADAQFRYQRVAGVTDEVTFTLRRFNLFVHAFVSDRVRVASEIELEEGGEEVKVELAAVDFEIHPTLSLRAGIVLSPLGRFNLAHDSPANEMTDRPLVSTEILAATLSEPGIGVFGALGTGGRGRVSYEAYAVNGFHDGVLTGSGEGPRLAEGKDNWEDENARPALVGRVAVSPHPGLDVGVSGHAGPYNVYRRDGQPVEERRDVRVIALDAEVARGRWRLGGEAARAAIDVPASLGFADRQRGFVAELSARVLDGSVRALPESHCRAVARWDFVDFDADGRGDDRRRLTIGWNFRPHPDTVFKLDWQRHWERDRFHNEEASAAILFSAASYF